LRITDVVSLAVGALADRKFRAALTILGIVIGPATIVALVAATQGFSNASSSQFEKLGATTIFVSSSINLTQADLNKIQALPGVAAVVPYDQLSGTINVAGTPEGLQIIATEISKLDSVLPALTLRLGSIPSASDITGAILGASVANPDVSGAKNLTVNEEVTVSQIQSQSSSFSTIGGGVLFKQGILNGGGSSGANRTFIVSGIYNPFGQGIQVNPDATIFVPLATAQSITHVYTYTSVLVQASNAGLVNQVSTEITNLFGSSKISAGTVSSLVSFQQTISQGISTLLEAVAGISVLVAFIGIMTTTFTSVLERTKEIGILKALGASGRNIMLTFLSEAALTGFVGGLIGAGAGSALSFLIVILLQGSSNGSPDRGGSFGGPNQIQSTSSTLAITPAITPELIVAAIVLASVVGMLAGLLPSWRASKLPPVDALRAV